MKVLKIVAENPNDRFISEAIRSMEDGHIVCIPTDSGYGFACNALNNSAVSKLCGIKGLDSKKKSLSIICNSIAEAAEFAKIPDDIFKSMRRNLPGHYTYILPALSKLPKEFKNRKEVGIRIPDNKVCELLTGQASFPIMVTSVPSGDESDIDYATEPELIAEGFAGRIDLVLDAGFLALNPTTIIDCTSGEEIILRQ
ncbi:MAG: threonylcarbamoyl-AMP synthase [Muribaculaceae bacterium]|nr:threonylcarbamoyl-AMP synthase [Muribaculaceae bacterium]